MRIAPESAGGAIAQPMRQPVTLNVFDNPLIVTVRSAMPSSVASGTCWCAVVDDVLVDLVGDGEHVPLLAEPRDDAQFLAREDLAGRVVRRVDDDRARAVRERRAPARRDRTASRARAAGRNAASRPRRSRRARSSRRTARRRSTSSPGSIVASSVAIIVSVDAAAHGDLRVGVDRHAVAARELRRDRLAQRPGAPGDGVLVDVGANRGARRLLDRRGRGKIRKALRQIDGAVLLRQPGHLADDRLGEPLGLVRRSDA